MDKGRRSSGRICRGVEKQKLIFNCSTDGARCLIFLLGDATTDSKSPGMRVYGRRWGGRQMSEDGGFGGGNAT